MSMKVSIDTLGMTFGDLYNFVDLARGAGIAPDQEVTQVMLPNDDSILDKFEVELTSGHIRKAPDLSGLDLGQLIQAIDEVIDSEGDARGVIPELKELRDRLL
ncbi:hypothetical protein GS575_07335 [Rhodococcus hoagii]|nr:hypothetical protein [Prescottella equi]